MEESITRQHTDEISLKELILKIREYIRYLWTKKWWIIIVGLIGSVVGFYRAYTTDTTYTAELTFMVNEDDGKANGGVGAILGQIGFGGGARSEYNLDKIVSLGKSRRMLENVLLSDVVTEEDTAIIANKIIELYDFQSSWAESKNKELEFFHFKNSILDSNDRTSNYVLNYLQKIVKEDLGEISSLSVVISYEEETGILTLQSRTLSEELSIAITKKLYQELSSFYVNKKIERQRETFERISFTADSIKRKLSVVEYQLAQFNDRSLNLMQQRDQVKKQSLLRESQLLTGIYIEAIKNRETSLFILKNETPFFQIIDAPRYPLSVVKKSYKYESATFGVMASVLLGIILLFSKMYSEIIK